MTRFALLISFAAISLFSVGCCGPIGPGCRVPMGCSDCDGMGQPIAATPLQSMRNLRKSLVCGSGCGEVYVGEWMSTPPDSADPCCGDQWVGGATKCRPFCWEPGTILGNLYGGRFCSGAQSSTPCDCGSASCDGGCGEYYDEGYITEDYSHQGSPNGGSACGCATCDARSSIGSSTRVAGRIPTFDPMTGSSTRNTADRMRR